MIGDENMTKERKAAKSFKKNRLKLTEELQGFVFISPWLLGFLIFTAGPMLFSLYASFTNYNITSKFDFIGFANYIEMFKYDKLFKVSLYNTIYYVVFMVPLTTVGAVFLGVLLNQGVAGMRWYRTIFYLPAVLSGVGVYLLWMQLLSPSTGLVNTMLSWIGIQGPAWLFDPNWTKPSLIIMKLWSLGGGMLLYLATLQNVPSQLYESAEIDGASAIRRFWHITIPLITPVIFFDLVVSTIGAFQIFQEAYIMANGEGGPMNSLLFYNFHLWNKAFKVFDMGYASAMAWVLLVIVMSITLINLKFAKHWVHYEGGDNK
jgi:multiple sugar transport system permease protein